MAWKHDLSFFFVWEISLLKGYAMVNMPPSQLFWDLLLAGIKFEMSSFSQ